MSDDVSVRDRASAARELLGLAWRTDRRRTAVLICAAFLEAACAALTAWLLKVIVDAVSTGQRQVALLVAVALAAQVTFFQTCSFAAGFMRARVGYEASSRATQSVMALALQIPGIEHFERPEYLDRLKLLRDQLPVLTWSVWSLLETVGEGLRLSVLAGLLAAVDPVLLTLVLFAAPSVWNATAAQRTAIKARERVVELERQERYLFELATGPVAAKELRVFRLESTILARRRAAYEHAARKHVEAEFRARCRRSASNAVFALGLVAFVGFVVSQASRGRATAGDVVLAFSAGYQLQGNLTHLSLNSGHVASLWRGVTHYAWLRKFQPHTAVADDASVEAPRQLCEGIALRHVSFRYEGTAYDVLSDVTLNLPAGRVIAIVGENGAGKSTLVKLLLGMYQPSSGAITVDGIPLNRIDVAEWRRRTTAVFEDFARLELVVRDGVGVGDVAAIGDSDRVWGALDRAGGGFVRSLPGGVDTQCGTRFADGVDLSGGEWQSLAMARGLVREDPLMLILDEPTSGLDAAAEHGLFNAHAVWARGCSVRSGGVTLMISHRFSTVRTADVIIVLKDGRVEAVGSHEVLMARGGTYAELYELQAGWYRAAR